MPAADHEIPTGALVVERPKSPTASPFYAAKWRSDGRQFKRRLGPAWLVSDGAGGWKPRSGRVAAGHLDEKRAIVEMAAVIARHASEIENAEEIGREAERRALTFRALAHAWLDDREHVERIKPSTLRGYRSILAEPGVAHLRGAGQSPGHIMAALGDLPAHEVKARHVEALLRTIDKHGASPRTVNWYRSTLRAIFNYGAQPTSGFGLTDNPASATRPRREDGPARLTVYSVEEVEALARAAETGAWRKAAHDADSVDRRRSPALWARTAETLALHERDDRQLAELFRVAAYSGLRQGELRALRWRDIHWGDRVLFVERAVSDTVESSTKGRRVRVVPLADQALAALDRLAQRENFTAPDDYVFANVVGDRLDRSALRRRYVAARDAAELSPLRFHDLRHTAGTLLARVLDPATVRDILGHSDLRTTARYLHAVKASALADAATTAFAPAHPDEGRAPGASGRHTAA